MRRFRRALLAALLAFALPLAQAAQLRVGMAADVTSMDPHAVNITPNNNIAWHVFDALVHVDADARLVPGLAASWRALDDTTWEFALRRGVRFHDGSPFTAEDAVFSIRRARELPRGQYAAFVQRLVSVQAIDPFTLRVRTDKPYALVPADLNSIFIVSHRAAEGASTEDFNSGKAMIGTGAFRFVRFARGERVELAKNPAYWGGASPWDQLVFRIIASDPARIAALLAGDVDVIESIPTADLALLRKDARFYLAQKTSWRTIFFHMDQYRDRSPYVRDASGAPLARNPFRDARVRLAVSKAINRQAIAERVMEGAAHPAGYLVAPSVFGYVDLKPEAYDPAGAKELLARAGYPQGFSLTLHAPNNRYVNDEQVAQAVAQMLTRVGIRTRVETQPINVYLPKARGGEFSFAMLGWGSFSADLALRALLATADAARGFGTWNWSRYSNARVDALLERDFAAVDAAKREALAREAGRLAMADTPLLLLHHQVAVWALRQPLRYAGRTDEYTFAHHIRAR